MNRTEHLLFIVAEEAAEVGHRASKAARFGLNEVQSDRRVSNRDRLLGEFADLCGALELATGSTVEQIVHDLRPMFEAKKAKIEEFLRYSAEQGTLSELQIGQELYYGMVNDGGALIRRTAEGYELYEIPLYGGEPRFHKTLLTLGEAQGIADGWT